MRHPTPLPSSEHASRSMRGNRSSGTAPETAVRRKIHALGYRYRLNTALRLGRRLIRPDIVFRRHKTVVFIDGCYWHGCPDHCRFPQANRAYWQEKIGRNRLRDQNDAVLLKESGWTALRFWEHCGTDEIVAQIDAALEARLA